MDKIKVIMALATFGAGCFWGVEQKFRHLPGVENTIVGFMGGHTKNPTYDEVCSHKTGHAEVVQIQYNPRKITYQDLLKLFWNAHNPTLINQQGSDVGNQYRSVIFYHDEEQKKLAEASKAALSDSGQYTDPIATEITKALEFYPAEEYHQRYLEKHRGFC